MFSDNAELVIEYAMYASCRVKADFYFREVILNKHESACVVLRYDIGGIDCGTETL